MTEYIEMNLEGEMIKVEVDSINLTGEVDVGIDTVTRRISSSFDEAMKTIVTLGKALLKGAKSVDPTETTVEFGLKIDAEAGAIVAKTTTGAQFTIKLTWKDSDQK